MTTGTLHPLARDYLERLRHAAEPLPRDVRHDLLAEIEAHLAEALPGDATEAEALTVLDRLGTPEEIVAPELPAPAADPRGAREWAAIFLLLLGGFAFGVGWIAGVILLWSSRAWSTLDKWIGTLVVPGGLAATLLVLTMAGGAGGSGSCQTGPGGTPIQCTPVAQSGTPVAATVLLVILAVAPIGTSIYLAHRAA
jgi:hypothetical protein